jgi:type IV pilus assembly protein PilO
MNDVIAKLLRLKTPIKVAIPFGVLAVIGVLYYILFYMDLSDAITAQQSRAKALQGERESYEKRKKEYVAFREELRKLQDEQRELLKALPKKAELPSFLQNVQEQAELAGLEVARAGFGSEVPEQDLYVKIPIQMEVRGSFHALTKFLKNVAELRRIVNVEDIKLIVERKDNSDETKLRATFVAATFRYNERGGS